MAFVDDLNASLGNLNSSVNPNFQPASQVGSYSAPSYTALNLPTFNFTPQDFASGSSGNAPALQSALSQTGTQPNGSSSGGGFWHNAWNDIVKAGETVPTFIMGANEYGTPAAPAQASDVKSIIPAPLVHAAQRVWEMWNSNDPGSVAQNVESNATYNTPGAATLADIGLSLATPGLPLGKIADAIGLTNAAKSGASAVANGLSKIPGVGDKFSNANNAISDTIKQGWNRYNATNAVDQQQAIKNIQNIFKNTTPEERQAVTHIIEQAPGYEQLLQQMPHLQPIVEDAKTLLDTSGQDVLDRGLIGQMNPNYMPHILVDKFGDGGGIFANSAKPLKPYLSSSKSRQLEGTISEINQRAANGEFNDLFNKLGLQPGNKLFEDDAAKLLTAHVLQNSKAKNLYDFIHNTVLPNAQKITDIPAVMPEGMGVYRPDTFKFFPQMVADTNVGRDAIDGMVPLEELHPGMGVSANTPAYMMPKADAQFLNNAFRVTPPSNMHPAALALLGALGKGIAGVNSLARTTMLYNPLVHLLNNVPWQVALKDAGALNPFGESGWAQYLNEAKNGAEEGSMYERAAKAGAISAPHSEFSGGIHSIANQLVDSLNKSNVLSKLNPYNLTNAATWIPEHAIRANMFARALENGATEEQAAKDVNSVLGSFSHMSKGEQNVQKYVFPFYNWMKTSALSNAKAALENPKRFAALGNLMNQFNESNTGHGLAENPDGYHLRVAMPWKNTQGNQFYFEPYNPAVELAKILEQGPVDYAFRRTNPTLKFATALTTGIQDPFAKNKFNVVQYPDLPGGANNPLNKKPLFFGNKGPLVNPWIADVAQTFGNPISDIGQTENSTLPETLTRLLGSYGTYYNPQSTVKEQKYQKRQSKTEYRSAVKAHNKYLNGQ